MHVNDGWKRDGKQKKEGIESQGLKMSSYSCQKLKIPFFPLFKGSKNQERGIFARKDELLAVIAILIVAYDHTSIKRKVVSCKKLNGE